MASDYRDILVILETRDGKIRNRSLEVLTKARELADDLGSRVEGLLLGTENLEELGETTIHHGADIVLVAEHEGLTLGNVDAYYQTIHPVVKERKPEIVLMSATPLGLDLGPRLAAALGTGCLSDATKLEIDPTDRLLLAKRLTYDGSVEAAATIPEARPQIASLAPGAVRVGFPDDFRYGKVEQVDVEVPRDALKVELVELEDAEPQEPPLPAAEVVVGGGLGFDGKKLDLVQDLARELGGAWGASRAAVQFGLAPEDRQIGATGHKIKPKLYIAAGVSGAFEHYLGVQDAEVVVGINPDKNASLWHFAQYGLIGDANTIIPAILEELKRD